MPTIVGNNEETKCATSKSKNRRSITKAKLALASVSAPTWNKDTEISKRDSKVGLQMINPKAPTTRDGTSGDGPLLSIEVFAQLLCFLVGADSTNLFDRNQRSGK